MKKEIENRKFCVAPMMGYTTPHARRLYRMLSAKTFLFTDCAFVILNIRDFLYLPIVRFSFHYRTTNHHFIFTSLASLTSIAISDISLPSSLI